jgi:hypothetical protein
MAILPVVLIMWLGVLNAQEKWFHHKKKSSSSPFRAAISHRFAERCVRRGYPTSPRFIFSGLTAHAHILHTHTAFYKSPPISSIYPHDSSVMKFSEEGQKVRNLHP